MTTVLLTLHYGFLGRIMRQKIQILRANKSAGLPIWFSHGACNITCEAKNHQKAT